VRAEYVNRVIMSFYHCQKDPVATDHDFFYGPFFKIGDTGRFEKLAHFRYSLVREMGFWS